VSKHCVDSLSTSFAAGADALAGLVFVFRGLSMAISVCKARFCISVILPSVYRSRAAPKKRELLGSEVLNCVTVTYRSLRLQRRFEGPDGLGRADVLRVLSRLDSVLNDFEVMMDAADFVMGPCNGRDSPGPTRRFGSSGDETHSERDKGRDGGRVGPSGHSYA
jgi:hypothetical protein